MAINRIAFLLSFLFLAACAAAEQEGEAVATPLSQPPSENPDPVVPEPITEEPVSETPVTEIAPELAIVAPNPEDLMGLEPKVIQELLGPVSLKRWEGSVQVMQFANEHCIMDIYLYEKAPGAAFEVAYLNARLKDGAEISTEVCLMALLPDGQWPEKFGETVLSGQ